MPENSDKIRPGLAMMIMTIFILPAFFRPVSNAGSEENKPPPQTWRLYNTAYNHVWNSLVRVVVEDWKYALRAADPEEGFIATWSKTQPQQKQGAPQKRISINVNVKKATEGTLVTVSCIIEEYNQGENGRKGRWITTPSDNLCESMLLDAVKNKLGGK